MPLAVDSVGRVTFNYSIANISRVNASNRTAKITQQEAVVEPNNNKNERIIFQELPKEEVKSLFFNQQESQLTRDILNTFATDINDTQRSGFTFSNIDTFQRLIDEREFQRRAEIDNENSEFLDEIESQRRADATNINDTQRSDFTFNNIDTFQRRIDERVSQRIEEIENENEEIENEEIDNEYNEFLDEREFQRRVEINNEYNESLDERESQRRAEIDNVYNEFLDERESQRRAEIDNENIENNENNEF